MKAKVAERGQVTIPKALRDKLGITPGTVLDFAEKEGALVAVKIQLRNPVDRVYGALGSGRSTDKILRELRDEG